MFLVYICKGNTKVFIIKMFSRKTLLKVLHLTFIKYCLSNIIVLFTFVYNSLISVIYYKVYNEPPGVGTATKILISVIYYNVYNVMGWAPGSRKGGTGAILHAWQHRGTRQGAKVQRATLHTRHHRGTRNGRKQKNRRPDGRRFLNRFIFSKVCKVEPFYFVTKDLLYFCFH